MRLPQGEFMPKSLGKKLTIFVAGIMFLLGAALGILFSIPTTYKKTLDTESIAGSPLNAIKTDQDGNQITDSSVLSVSRVSIRETNEATDTLDGTVYSVVNKTDVLHDTTAPIKELTYVSDDDIPFVMLDTNMDTNLNRDGILIEFGVTGGKVYLSPPSITLNGVELAKNELIENEGESTQSFRQYIHALTPDKVDVNYEEGPNTGEHNPYSSLHYSYKTYTSGTNESPYGDLKYGTALNSIEGLYVISFGYRLVTDTGIGYSRTAVFKFYLVTEETYNKMNENTTFSYTEKYDYTSRILQLAASDEVNDQNTLKDTLYSKQHLFKFTNVFTSVQKSGAFSGTNPTTDYTVYTKDASNIPVALKYPVLKYNPEKYHIYYVKTLYNKQEQYDLSFTTQKTLSSERGILTITKTTSLGTTTETRYIERPASGIYEISLTFDQVGEYVFYKKCILRTGIGSYVDASNIELSDITLTMPESLSITGFQATYSTPDGDKELRDDSYDTNGDGTLLNKYTADYTFQNKSLAINVATSDIRASCYLSEFETKTTEITAGLSRDDGEDNVGIKISTTNQAPVKFVYNATLTAGLSWYIFYDTKGNRSTGDWTKSTKFERAGTYVVYTVFNNCTLNAPQGYTFNAGIQSIGPNGLSIVAQVFVFKITNTPPAVSIYTIEEGKSASTIDIENTNTLSVNGFTNKNVYLKWNLAGPFDTEITANYSCTNFRTNASEVSNAACVGLKIKVVDEFSSIFGDKSATTILSLNGIYTIKVFYTNSRQSSLSLNFTIDKEQISGIKALKVNSSTQRLPGADPESTELYNLESATISSLDSFTLTTTNSFVWTWDTKASGAEITAQYTYASLNAITNFQAEAINNDSNIWVTANGQFGTFAPLMNYLHTVVTPQNANSRTFLSTQICSTARLQVLLLSDAAGNKAIFITILENVDPEMIQQAVGEEPAKLSVISKNTKFTWGTHKALKITTADDKIDIGDIVNDNESSVIAGYDENFDKYNAIKNSLTNFIGVSGANLYMNIKINEVSFAGSGGDMGAGEFGQDQYSRTITFKQPSNSSVIPQQFIWVIVDTTNHQTYLSISNGEPFSVYQNSIITLNANQEGDSASLPDFYTYTINLKDVSENTMVPYTVEVNFDKSLGTMFSHYNKDKGSKVYNEDVTDTLLENEANRNRIRMQQNRSTNRQYVTFSFRQQESGSDFEVHEVYLYFYPIDTTNVNSQNYPYADEPLLSGESALIYKLGQANSLFRQLTIEERNGTTATYYHSYALQRLNYSSSFGGAASQDGKYVIVRKYKADFVDGTEGDVQSRTYTYYVDHGSILNGVVESTTHLTFGYARGTYNGYSEYGGTTFDAFENSTFQITEGNKTGRDAFQRAFNIYGNNMALSPYPVVSSNILPVGLELPYAMSTKYGTRISNKYLYPAVDPDVASNLVDRLQSMNVMVLVARSLVDDTAANSLTLYNHFTANDKEEQLGTGVSTGKIKNITKLSEEFKDVGLYRIIIFDLSNLSGTIKGEFKDLKPYLYSYYNSINVKYEPNYSMINFSITEVPPTATFEQKTGSSEYVTTSTSSAGTTGDTKSNFVRLTFSDTTDTYKAKIAYNDISVTRKLISINNETGTLSRPVTMSNPIFVTNNLEYYKTQLGITGDEELPDNMYSAVNNLIYSKDYAVLSYTLPQLLTFTDASYSSETDFTESNHNYIYLYSLIEGTLDRYNYYLYLPPTPNVPSYNVQMDCEYTANFHYIGDAELYKIKSSKPYVNYQSSTSVYVDHTSPYKNLKALINADEYLAETGVKNDLLTNLYDLDYEFLKTYAFAVDQDFWPTSYDTHENEERFFVRGPYNKYDYSTNEYMQMVVEGMADFERNTGAEKFLESKFLEGTDSKYRLCYYSNKISSAFAREGYYDIIERDSVENYRVYTVYVKISALSVSAIKNLDDTDMYQINEITGNEDGSDIYYGDALLNQFGDTSKAQSISSEKFIITSINTNDRWFTISYRNIAQNQAAPYTKINITPSVDLEQVIATLNATIVQICDANRYLAGSKIEFVIKNRVGNDLKFYLKTPGQRLSPTFTQIDSRHFSMTLPMNTAATQLIKPNEYVDLKFTVTLNGAPYNVPTPINDTEPYTYVFDNPVSGNYIFTFLDNFGYSYILTYPVDTSLVKELVYSPGAVENYVYNGIIHSLDSITLKFQSNTFTNVSVKITNRENNNATLVDTGVVDVSYFTVENDENEYWTIYNGHENDKESVLTSIIQTGIVNLTFKAIENTYYLYTVTIDDGTLSNSETYIFALYTYLPEIRLTDTSDVEIWQEDTEKTTSRDVKINWTVLNDKLFNPYVSLEYPSGDIRTISPPFTLYDEGTYTIRLGSTLGLALSRSITFTIQEYDISIFGVYLNGELLSPHPNLNTFTFTYSYDEGDIFGEGTTTLTKTMEQYFFYAANTTKGWDNITVSSNEDKDLKVKLAATYGNTRIYRVWGYTTHTLENFYAITLIPYGGTTLTAMTINDGTGTGDVEQSANSSKVVTLIHKDAAHYEKHAQNKTCEECAPPVVVKWNTAYYDTSYSSSNPFVYSNFIYLDLFYNGDFVGTFSSGEISLTQSGTYSIQIRNFVGQQHMFNVVYSSFTLTILYDVIYLINNQTPVQNAVYNDSVTLNLHDVSFYTMSSFRYEVYKNNVAINSSHFTFVNNTFTFTEPGVYRVAITVRVRGEQNKYIYGEANFSILSKLEAKTAYEVTKISGYEIISVYKQGDEEHDAQGNVLVDETGNTIYAQENITASLLAEGQTALYSALFAKDTTGVGRYTITVRTEAKNMTPSQTYTFSVWINDESPILTPSRDFGTSSTAAVTINYNKALIYQQVGTCSIVINGQTVSIITKDDAENTKPNTIRLSEPNDYYVQVYSESGFLVMSQRITITTPLNTASIILIVVGSLLVVGVTIAFILLRTRMRVK